MNQTAGHQQNSNASANSCRMRSRTVLIVLAIVFAHGTTVFAQNRMKRFAAENDSSNLQVRLTVNKTDRVYREGENLSLTVDADQDCFIYVINTDKDGVRGIIFPNKFQTENRVKAGQKVLVPPADSPVKIRTKAPFGREQLEVVASSTKIDSLEKLNPTLDVWTTISADAAARFGDDDGAYATDRVIVDSMPKADTQRPSERFAVSIGISNYLDPSVPDLNIAHLDAQVFSKSLVDVCGVKSENSIVLTNEQATRSAIADVFKNQLLAKTRPGDTIYIYFSGHGTRVSDVKGPDGQGDETDGYDEVLVPADGVVGRSETMIRDDTFANWMKGLDQRDLIIVMDCCHSGGASKSLKRGRKGFNTSTAGMKSSAGSKLAADSNSSKTKTVDGFTNEFRRLRRNRSKDLDQPGTVVIAAAGADQLAWEMDPGPQSTLTNYLIQALLDEASDLNHDGKVTGGELFQIIKPSIEKYVRDTYATEQTPQLIENSGEIAIRILAP